MANVVTNEFVEKCDNELKVFNALSLHEKVSYYLQKMEDFAEEGRTMLHRGELESIEEDDAMGIFVENVSDAMSMFEDNDLPSESPFEISEQELKDKHELIIDSIREISSVFCNFLNKMEHFDDDQPTTTELKQRMKAFLIVDRALLLEIDKE